MMDVLIGAAVGVLMGAALVGGWALWALSKRPTLAEVGEMQALQEERVKSHLSELAKGLDERKSERATELVRIRGNPTRGEARTLIDRALGRRP